MWERFLKFLGLYKEPCPKCKGTGKVTEWYSQIGSLREGTAVMCRSCDGKGKV